MTTTINSPKIMSINGIEISTAAQAITLIGYGDCNKGERANIPFRCLDFKCECENYNDLEGCLKLIDSYNDFDFDTMLPHLRKYLSIKKYYKEGNPNNGNDFFKFEIAREGSPAFYVSFMPQWDKVTMSGGSKWAYDLENFKIDMNILKELLKADEMDIEEGYKITARFWFD